MKNDPYIVAAFLKAQDQGASADGTNPIVTISRQHGTPSELIAVRTAEILTEMSHGQHPWIAVNKDIAERVISDHHLPRQTAHFLTGEHTVSIEDYVEGLLGISVSREKVVEKMVQTLIHLARLGHVVFVGRAAHVVTARFPRAAHIRLIGSFERRVERVMESNGCSRDEAAYEIREVDEKRRTFTAKHFGVDLDDPTHFDLIFNTDRMSAEEAARLIAHLVASPDFRKKEASQLVELRHQVLG